MAFNSTPSFVCKVTAVAALCALVALNAAVAGADPAPMTDNELDAVSARGFSYPSFGAGPIQPTTTNVVPFVPTAAHADSKVSNLVIPIAVTTNVVTAINQCIFSTCTDTSTDVTASPSTTNDVDIQNAIAPQVHNTTQVPIQISPQALGSFGGNVGNIPAMSANPQPLSTSAGMQRSAPPLPRHGFGGR